MKDYLLYVTDGNIQNADEFWEWSTAVVIKAQDLGHTRLLFDNRTCSLEITQHDVITISERWAGMNAPTLGLRYAVISSRGNPEISKFIETSFTNRSAAYKRFDSQKDALEWLLS